MDRRQAGFADGEIAVLEDPAAKLTGGHPGTLGDSHGRRLSERTRAIAGAPEEFGRHLGWHVTTVDLAGAAEKALSRGRVLSL